MSNSKTIISGEPSSVVSNAKNLLASLRDPENKNKAIDQIESIGNSEVAAMREMSPILDKSIEQLTNEKDSEILKNLNIIRQESKAMDKDNFNFSPNFFLKILQKITGNTPLAQYLNRFESAKDVISDINKSFIDGRISLQEDNALMISELEKFRKNRADLNQKIQLLEEASRITNDEISTMEDGEDKDFLMSTISHALATKTMDLQQVLAVTQQGEFGFNTIIAGNRQLIKSIDRVQSVTIPALQIATMMALVLANQKKVFDSTEAIAKETDAIMAQNADMIVSQSKQIAGQANSAIQNVDKIAENMQKMIDSVDLIEKSRLEALPEMNKAISTLKEISSVADQKLNEIDTSNQLESHSIEPEHLISSNSKKGE